MRTAWNKLVACYWGESLGGMALEQLLEIVRIDQSPLHPCGSKQKLATISSELRVRRLLWLRGALSAEQAGQTRLDLAALFGSCNELMDSLNEDTGSVSSHAPRFLHLLHGDLDALIPGFDGFRGSWKTDFLLTSLSCIRNLRVFHEPPPPLAGPGHAAPNVQAEVVAELRCDILWSWTVAKYESAALSQDSQAHSPSHSAKQGLPTVSEAIHYQNGCSKTLHLGVLWEQSCKSWSCRCFRRWKTQCSSSGGSS